MRLPAPLRIPAGADTRPGGAFLCSPFLLGPAPAASPEISQGHPGTAAVAVFWGDDGAAAGAAAPRGLRLPPTQGLLQEPPTIYEGPPGSYFGFALDFHMSEGSVAVGAPRANTSQPGVVQPGAVFLCSWPPRQDLLESQGTLELRTYKSHQWLGASVTSWDGKLVCAPLQHWNALEGQHEAFRTPTGTCFVRSPGQRRSVWYSPCRDRTMASTYPHDKRYCEIGFSAAVTPRSSLRGTPCAGCGASPASRYRCPVTPPAPLLLLSTPAPALPAHCAPGTPRCYPHPFQVASYFGHTVAVADVDGDGRDDLLVGAPLYMARRSDGQRSELGRLYVYLGRGQQRLAGPPQTLTGTHPYGRFAAAIASLGDLDKDGFGGTSAICSWGLTGWPRWPCTSECLSLHLRAPGLPLGSCGTSAMSPCPRGLPVVVARTQLSVPDGLNPEILNYFLPDSGGHCSDVTAGVTSATSRSPPELEAELQLDRLKPRPSRRVLLLRGHQSSWQEALVVAPGAVPVCRNLTAYLRDKAEFKDKLSPVALSVALTLPREAPGLVLYGDTLVQAQTHIILEDCGDDNLCVPDLHLAADTQRLLIGAEAVLSLRANATNAGEGAFEAELRVQLPPGTHYQAGQEKLSCNPRKENGTHVVLCELGNPMKAGARVRGERGPCCACHPLGLVTHLPLFSAVPRSPRSRPRERAGERGAGGPRPCGERGTLGMEAGLRLPGWGHIPWMTLGTYSPWWPQGWECPLGWGPSNTHRVGHHPQDCDNATCLDITCHVPSLGKDQRALVSIHALLWMDTLQQHLLTQFRIQSQAWFNISAMPYRVQPRVLPSGKAEVGLAPGGEGAVPVWWVVLGVLAGLLLLTLLIVVMWKVSGSPLREAQGGHRNDAHAPSGWCLLPTGEHL
uniref:Integrin subunit alpha 2b n=1 Tax=Serinus canaria TaxID=9135 RepID=A0A8C9MZ26_SERCA